MFWKAISQEDVAQESTLERCIKLLENIVREQPNNAQAHAELGRALGQLGLHRGGGEKIKLGKRVKEEGELALRIQPDNALALAVMGKWNYELANLSGIERKLGSLLFESIPEGSFDAAAELLRKSVKMNPKEVYHQLMLAKALLKAGFTAEARTTLEGMAKLAPREAPDQGYLAEAAKLLEDLGR